MTASTRIVRDIALDQDQTLVSRIRSGDATAFEALYHQFAAGLLGYAFAQLHSRELAEELVQDVFLGIWRHRAKLAPTHSLKAYLFGALRNRIISYRRTAAANHELQQNAGDRDASFYELPGSARTDDLMLESELLRALDRAVAELPSRSRETFLLVRRQQLSYAEAAAVLGISIKGVEMNMLRALRTLRLTPEQYRRFIDRAEAIVARYGKRMIGWGDIAPVGLRPETIVQKWHTEPVAPHVARGGKVILSPTKRAYLDMKYDSATLIGFDWAAFIEVRDAYDWDPAAFDDIPAAAVLGLEAPLWSETIGTRGDFDFLAFPRLPALAEVAWSPQQTRHWEEFRERLGAQGPRMTALGINFYPSPQIQWRR